MAHSALLSPIVRCASSSPTRRAERLSDHASEIGLAVRLREQQNARVKPAVMNDGIFGVAGRVKHLQTGSYLQRLFGEFPAINRTWHNHIGKQQVDRWFLMHNPQCLVCV